MTAAVTSSELLAVLAARQLVGRRLVFSGHGLPTLAVSLAQRTVAPDIQIVYESGVIGAHPTDLPRSISDSILVSGAECVLDMPALFGYVLQAGRVDVAFLGAAQIDRNGSLNSTLIGADWSAPTVRLPGSGGAIEAMAGAQEVFVVMRRHTPDTFVDQLDFCTSPRPTGRRAGNGTRPAPAGVTMVVSDLGILARDAASDEMTLVGVHPGVSVDDVRAATGWSPLRVADSVAVTAPPTDEELRVLREDLDPHQVYLR